MPLSVGRIQAYVLRAGTCLRVTANKLCVLPLEYNGRTLLKVFASAHNGAVVGCAAAATAATAARRLFSSACWWCGWVSVCAVRLRSLMCIVSRFPSSGCVCPSPSSGGPAQARRHPARRRAGRESHATRARAALAAGGCESAPVSVSTTPGDCVEGMPYDGTIDFRDWFAREDGCDVAPNERRQQQSSFSQPLATL